MKIPGEIRLNAHIIAEDVDATVTVGKGTIHLQKDSPVRNSCRQEYCLRPLYSQENFGYFAEMIKR
ncbi:MAG: hypothetical protein PVF58_19490 [Candidatus Methanofastidiosia archaeon]|jgi:hypothetical protein